jgi:hypothetical protein
VNLQLLRGSNCVSGCTAPTALADESYQEWSVNVAAAGAPVDWGTSSMTAMAQTLDRFGLKENSEHGVGSMGV